MEVEFEDEIELKSINLKIPSDTSTISSLNPIKFGTLISTFKS